MLWNENEIHFCLEENSVGRFYDNGRNRRMSYEPPDENRTTVTIPSIEKPTTVSLRGEFDSMLIEKTVINLWIKNESKGQLYTRIRQLFDVISENKNVVKLKIYGFETKKIPGALLAEFFYRNKYATEIFFQFADEQSDMNLLCDALQQDNTIKKITFNENFLDDDDLKLLGKAVHKNKGIEELQFDNTDYNNLGVLKAAFRPGNNIKVLTLMQLDTDDSMLMDEYDPILSNDNFVNLVEKILSENSLLTSFTFKRNVPMVRDMVPILRGVINSKITEFHCDLSWTSGDDDDFYDENSYRYQIKNLNMIAKMEKLKIFSFDVSDFDDLSSEQICSAIRCMSSLNLLEMEIGYMNHNVRDAAKEIVEGLSTWERQFNLKLKCSWPSIELLSILKSVRLESFSFSLNSDLLVKLIENLPSWHYLKELNIHWHDVAGISQVQESNFAAAVWKSGSLKKIASHTLTLSSKVQSKIDYAFARNECLSESKEHPKKIPVSHWPVLYASASTIGVDYLYEYIQKTPAVFKGFLCSGIEQDYPSSEHRFRNFHNKRDISESKLGKNAKRARTFKRKRS